MSLCVFLIQLSSVQRTFAECLPFPPIHPSNTWQNKIHYQWPTDQAPQKASKLLNLLHHICISPQSTRLATCARPNVTCRRQYERHACFHSTATRLRLQLQARDDKSAGRLNLSSRLFKAKISQLLAYERTKPCISVLQIQANSSALAQDCGQISPIDAWTHQADLYV